MNTSHDNLRRYVRTIALAALVAAVAACTDDNGTSGGDTSGVTIPVTFSAAANPGNDTDESGAPATRTVFTPTPDGGYTVSWKGADGQQGRDDIYIAAFDEQGKPAQQDFLLYYPAISAVSSPLVADGEEITVPRAGNWKFTALHVSNFRSIEFEQQLNVVGQSQSKPGDTGDFQFYDYSVATATKDITGDGSMPAEVSLEFKPLLAAVQFHVRNETGAPINVKEIRLASSGGAMTTARTYVAATQAWKDGADLTEPYLSLSVYQPEPLAGNVQSAQDFYMFLFPGLTNAQMTITVITDCGVYTLTKPAPATGFAAGINYTVNLAVRSSGLAGNETWKDYTTINNADQLIAFANSVNGGNTYAGETVSLLADIDLQGQSWTPIGKTDTPFKGKFDGGGHHISGLSVDASSGPAGLFGKIEDAEVYSLRVSGNVHSADVAGGIVGDADVMCFIQDCIFNGDVNADGIAGGIVGTNTGAYITSCLTKGSVTSGNGIAGGIAGKNGKITSCYSEAEVSGGSGAGGIVGVNNGHATLSYATGKISGTHSVGGIVGENTGKVGNCMACNSSLVRLSGNDAAFGRIVGKNTGTVIDNAAFGGMTLPAGISPTADANGVHGTGFTVADSYNFIVLTSGTDWFSDSTPWTYMPWNSFFENFSGIRLEDYRITVPEYLKPKL